MTVSYVEEALRELLISFEAVAALTAVGTTGDYLIRPDRLEQDDDETQPHVVIEVDREDPQNDLTGKGGLVYAEVTIRCRDRTKAGARALAEAIRRNDTDPGTGLAGYHGTISGFSLDAVLEDTQIAFVPETDGSSRGWWDVFQSYMVSFAEVT